MKFALREICPYGFAVTSIALVVLVVFSFNSNSRIERLKIDNLKLREQLAQTGPAELFSWDIEAMKKKGLKDPANDIVSALKQHRELIPHAGSMGGTMNFFDKSKIRVLTGKWVFAYFEDGHNGGYVLLEYEVRDGGAIVWKTVASYVA